MHLALAILRPSLQGRLCPGPAAPVDGGSQSDVIHRSLAAVNLLTRSHEAQTSGAPQRREQTSVDPRCLDSTNLDSARLGLSPDEPRVANVRPN